MSACQDRKVTDEQLHMPFFNEISETLPVCPRSGYTTHPNWVSSWSRQSRPRYVFGNVFTSSSYFIKGRYQMISYHYQDVGWSVLDVALSPDGGHLVYSSWSDSLHQVGLRS